MGYAVLTVKSAINSKTGLRMSCRLELGLDAWWKEINWMFAGAWDG
jgi:hypothetical protein